MTFWTFVAVNVVRGSRLLLRRGVVQKARTGKQTVVVLLTLETPNARAAAALASAVSVLNALEPHLFGSLEKALLFM